MNRAKFLLDCCRKSKEVLLYKPSKIYEIFSVRYFDFQIYTCDNTESVVLNEFLWISKAMEMFTVVKKNEGIKRASKPL